jgi:hypothetical protein
VKTRAAEVALQAGEVEFLFASPCHFVLVFANDRCIGYEREGHHLRDDNALALVAEFVGQRFRADETHIEELPAEAFRARLPDEGGTGLVGADLDNRLGAGRNEGFHCLGHVDGIAFDRGRADQLELPFGQRALDTFEAGLAIGVVLVEDSDFFGAQRGEMLNDAFRLVEVAGTYVEDVAVERLAQRLCTGEHAHNRDLGFSQDWHGCQPRRGAHRADQGEHLVLLDQGPDGHLGLLGLVTIVARHQLEPPSVDPARAVDRLEVGLDARAHALAELAGRAAESSELAHGDFLVGYPGFSGVQSKDRASERKNKHPSKFHFYLSVA